ncbi:MAG TPA: antitoxin Xre-like helix-turn-helix domain-containing protein [Candidatus Polarisedimenticolaceae bacterium]
MARSQVAPVASEGAVLAKAFLRASDRLGLSQRQAAAVLGVSEATLSRVASGRPIDPSSKEGEIAILFVRAFRSLDALVGGREADARAWMHAENRHLGGVPAALACTITGLVDVVGYLDAVRGKL